MGFRPDRAPLDTRPTWTANACRASDPVTVGARWALNWDRSCCAARRRAGCRRARSRSATASTTTLRRSPASRCSTRAGGSACSGAWTWTAGRRTSSKRSARGRCGCDRVRLGHGNRWYKVRVGAHYGLMKDVGVPGFVDPGRPVKLWIDWDGRYDEHTEAWEREARIRRAVSERTDNKFDSTLNRLNPFAGKLRPEDEASRARRRASRSPTDPIARDSPPRPHAADGRVGRAHAPHRGARTGSTRSAARRKAPSSRARTPAGRSRTSRSSRSCSRSRAAASCSSTSTARCACSATSSGREVDVWIDPEDPDAICPELTPARLIDAATYGTSSPPLRDSAAWRPAGRGRGDAGRDARSQRRAVGAHRARVLAPPAPVGARRVPRARLSRRDHARDRASGRG